MEQHVLEGAVISLSHCISPGDVVGIEFYLLVKEGQELGEIGGITAGGIRFGGGLEGDLILCPGLGDGDVRCGDGAGVVGGAAHAEQISTREQISLIIVNMIQLVHSGGKFMGQGIQSLLIVGDAPLYSGIRVIGGAVYRVFAGFGQHFTGGLERSVQVVII